MPLAAPLGRRLAARAIDLALALLLLYLVTRFVPAGRLLGRLALGLGVLSAYEALFVLQLRATPGKLATSLRVAQLDRAGVDPIAAWTRGAATSVGTLALVVLPVAVGVMTDSGPGLVLGGVVVAVAGGFALSVAAFPLRRGVADRMADTMVVPFEAPEMVLRSSVDAATDAERPRPQTAWGPVASLDARRRARAARLDDAPLLVVGLVAVILAWTFDRPVLAVALSCAWIVAFAADEAWRVARDGGTSGHRREGLAVVDEVTGEAPTTGRSLARAATLAVFWLFPPLLPVLWVWMQVTPAGRGPHDLVAGTVVVQVEDRARARPT